jgi:hypothetical protein
MYQFKAIFLLHTNDIFGTYGIRPPQVFKVILAIPPAELSGQIIDIVERVPLKYSFNLSEHAYVASNVFRGVVVAQIRHPYVLASGFKLFRELTAYYAQSASYQDFTHLSHPFP